MKIKRKIIQIDDEKCDGCGVCVPSCAEGALQIVNGKARLAAEKYCDGLGACLGECPNDALHVIEREAEDFDEKAVEDHLQSKGAAHHERRQPWLAAVRRPIFKASPRPTPARKPISRYPTWTPRRPLLIGRCRSGWYPRRPRFSREPIYW